MVDKNEFIAILQNGTIKHICEYMIENKYLYVNLPLPEIDTRRSYDIHYIEDLNMIPYLANIGYYKNTYSRRCPYEDFAFIVDFKYNHKFIL